MKFDQFHNCRTIFVALVLVLFASGAASAPKLITDEELTLRMGDVSANKFPFILAYDQGFYEKNVESN